MAACVFSDSRISLVVAETVVGATTGVVGAPKGYFKGRPASLRVYAMRLNCFVAVKSVCDKYGALLILDEVRSSDFSVGSIDISHL